MKFNQKTSRRVNRKQKTLHDRIDVIQFSFHILKALNLIKKLEYNKYKTNIN